MIRHFGFCVLAFAAFAAGPAPAAVTPSTPAPANPTDRALLDRMGVRGTGEGE